MTGNVPKKEPKTSSVRRFTKGWDNRVTFLCDLVSTDHKIFFSDKGSPRQINLLEEVIEVAHQLPGYFMCVGSMLIGSKPFLKLKKEGREFTLEGIDKIVDYISAVSLASSKHSVTMSSVLSLARAIGATDPEFFYKDGWKISKKLLKLPPEE